MCADIPRPVRPYNTLSLCPRLLISLSLCPRLLISLSLCPRLLISLSLCPRLLISLSLCPRLLIHLSLCPRLLISLSLCPRLLIHLLSCSRLQALEDFGNRVQRALDVIDEEDPSQHLYDPVNAFQLVNRYINGWMVLHDTLYEDNAQGR